MNEKLSLSELQLIIRDSLYMALPGIYWVVAEISEIRENYSGHCYLELVEKHPEEQSIRARVKGVIWNSMYRLLKPVFENTTGESLRVGIKILVRAKIEYHEIYGLSLVISDIDPSYTLGEMALKRQQILKRLEDEGVLTMNKELEFPAVPQRIAVVSSKNAAGYGDFMKHLSSNIFGYAFHTVLIETPMQGADTEEGVIRALELIATRTDMLDAVVIIRGGGSQTDLSWFDNYNIAYLVTQFPLPVLTGIGHEKDLSVTDIVAFRSLKTPTAVADFLIECMNGSENHINEMCTAIIDNSRLILEHSRKSIENHRIRLIPVARMMISEVKESLSGMIIEMINTGKEYILRAGLQPANQMSRLVMAARSALSNNSSSLKRKHLEIINSTASLLIVKNSMMDGFENSLKILDPENVLKRGYTITSINRKIVKSVSQVSAEDLLNTLFSDGTVVSRVVERSGNGKVKEGTGDEESRKESGINKIIP